MGNAIISKSDQLLAHTKRCKRPGVIPYGCALFSEKDLIVNNQKALENLEAILSDNGEDMRVASLYRSIYKYTECGPWLSVQLHNGNWKHCDDLHGVENAEILALLVGSIVEGSDAEVTGDVLDLSTFATPCAAVAAFNAQVETVNAEACALWEEANGEGF
jgi:hypothetical protein